MNLDRQLNSIYFRASNLGFVGLVIIISKYTLDDIAHFELSEFLVYLSLAIVLIDYVNWKYVIAESTNWQEEFECIIALKVFKGGIVLAGWFIFGNSESSAFWVFVLLSLVYPLASHCACLMYVKDKANYPYIVALISCVGSGIVLVSNDGWSVVSWSLILLTVKLAEIIASVFVGERFGSSGLRLNVLVLLKIFPRWVFWFQNILSTGSGKILAAFLALTMSAADFSDLIFLLSVASIGILPVSFYGTSWFKISAAAEDLGLKRHFLRVSQLSVVSSLIALLFLYSTGWNFQHAIASALLVGLSSYNSQFGFVLIRLRDDRFLKYWSLASASITIAIPLVAVSVTSNGVLVVIGGMIATNFIIFSALNYRLLRLLRFV